MQSIISDFLSVFLIFDFYGTGLFNPLVLYHAYTVIECEHLDGRKLVRTWWSLERGLTTINICKGRGQEIVERTTIDNRNRKIMGVVAEGPAKNWMNVQSLLVYMVAYKASLKYNLWDQNCKDFSESVYNFCSQNKIVTLDAADKLTFCDRWAIYSANVLKYLLVLNSFSLKIVYF